jgi:phosphatidylserine decarboxylase
MKHSGKARKAAFKMLLITLVLVLLVPLAGFLATLIGGAVVILSSILFCLWLLFALFTLYFFRDPTPRVPPGASLVVSPAHGRVDVIDTIREPQFMGGECQRISMFLSVINVHVQNAPISGKVLFNKYTEGQFLNAMKTECASCNGKRASRLRSQRAARNEGRRAADRRRAGPAHRPVGLSRR